MPHFLLHCAAVSLVVIGVIALVTGENTNAPASMGLDIAASKGAGTAKAPATPRSSALSTLRARTAAGGTQRERGVVPAAKHNI